jgi:ubiquitin-conjugating enzyme E2 D/E
MLARLGKELREMANEPPENCSAGIANDDIKHWNATILGPNNSPFENGIFRLDIFFPDNYPFKAPKIFFKTRIFHPNIDYRGRICLDIINERWTPLMTVSKALLSISSILDDPNPDDPMEPEIAKLYKEDIEKYITTAKEWTARYASE